MPRHLTPALRRLAIVVKRYADEGMAPTMAELINSEYFNSRTIKRGIELGLYRWQLEHEPYGLVEVQHA